MKKATTIMVYLDDGRVFSYSVSSADKGREHASAIVVGGYRTVREGVLEHYPPHRILKVKVSPATTKYPDEVHGT